MYPNFSMLVCTNRSRRLAPIDQEDWRKLVQNLGPENGVQTYRLKSPNLIGEKKSPKKSDPKMNQFFLVVNLSFFYRFLDPSFCYRFGIGFWWSIYLLDCFWIGLKTFRIGCCFFDRFAVEKSRCSRNLMCF